VECVLRAGGIGKERGLGGRSRREGGAGKGKKAQVCALRALIVAKHGKVGIELSKRL